MHQYLHLVQHILDKGVVQPDRTGTGTRSVFGHQMRFDLLAGFPLLTTKKIFLKGVIHELLWFLKGETNIKYLVDNGVHIWDAWADETGELGPVYGSQWRSWPVMLLKGYPEFVEHSDGSKTYFDAKVHAGAIDQIANVVNSLKVNPSSRRHIVSAWNPAEVDIMALPPCHCLFQFYTRPLTAKQRAEYFITSMSAEFNQQTMFELDVQDEARAHAALDERHVPRYELDCQLYQRSADVFLGVPFNIASYALLTMMVAQQTNMVPGDFVWTGGDCHIYNNHVEQVGMQLSRVARPLPAMQIKKASSIFDYQYEDFTLLGYDPHPAIKGEISV